MISTQFKGDSHHQSSGSSRHPQPLENDINSVQGRLSSPEFRELTAPLNHDQQQPQSLALGPHHHLHPLFPSLPPIIFCKVRREPSIPSGNHSERKNQTKFFAFPQQRYSRKICLSRPYFLSFRRSATSKPLPAHNPNRYHTLVAKLVSIDHCTSLQVFTMP
jgi:hypothetical protein